MSRREWNTNERCDWNAPIHQILKAIDNHNKLWISTGNSWHRDQAAILRTYVSGLKRWIHSKELESEINKKVNNIDP
jgi:hypothetical protein